MSAKLSWRLPLLTTARGAASALWRICDHTAFVVSSPERVVVLTLAIPGSRPKGLIGSAAVIWQFLCGLETGDPRPVIAEADLLDALADAYGMDPRTLSSDVSAFLTSLADEGLVSRIHADGAQLQTPPQ